jgi:hypothetical protein
VDTIDYMHEFYTAPNPPPYPRPVPVLDSTFRPRDGRTDTMARYYWLAPLDENTSILVHDEYENDNEESAKAVWFEPEKTEPLFRTCVAYEHLGQDHPRILKYLGRDPWTGFPLLQRPEGPNLEVFLKEHHSRIYEPGFGTHISVIDVKHIPLIINWALQSLSMLKFLHSHNMRARCLDTNLWYLSSTLSISLAGLLYSDFTDSFGYRKIVHYSQATTQRDLWSWGMWYYHLFFNYSDGANLDYFWPTVSPQHDANPEGVHPDIPGYKVLLKCRVEGYESAIEVWNDFEAALKEEGYIVEGDSLKDFGPVQSLGYVFERDALEFTDDENSDLEESDLEGSESEDPELKDSTLKFAGL